MLNLAVENHKFGLISPTKIEEKSAPRGSASDILNWFARGDKIELSRGYKLIGTDAGAGQVTGLFTARKADGTEVPYRTRGKKLEYYDADTADWVEVGTDQLGTDADGEEVTIRQYDTTAGNQVWLCSPNSSLYKIMVANPGSITDMYDSTKNFKGYIDILLNRMFLWNRIKDGSGAYASYIDNLNSTAVADEVLGTGDGSTKTFAGTLAFKAGDAQRTCFGIEVTDGVETFTDDYSGNLTGSLGGSGTINYTTGAISVTFNTAPANAQDVTVDYSWEDSTDNGIADFTMSGTRLAGEGAVFRQDSGGKIKNILTYNDIQYCLHEFNTWRLNIGADDTEATNRIYRELAGIPNWRAAVTTGDGIYYVDDSNINNPQFRLLQLDVGSSEVIPISKSLNIDLSDYRFDKAAAFEFDDYILFACRTEDETQNNRVFIYSKTWKNWTIREYWVSCFTVYDGALWAGDSITNNVYEIFSGWDDDDSIPDNYYITNQDDLDTKRLKKVKKFGVQGAIGREQSFKIYTNEDNSGWIYVGEITGRGSYVDYGTPVTVGPNTIGKKTIGGSGDEIEAYNYDTVISINTDKFKEIRIKFVAQYIGYLSISMYEFRDIRRKSQRIPKKYR